MPSGAQDQLDPSDTALLETLLLEAPVAFAFYDRDLRYRRINRALARTNGLSVEEHIGRRPSEVLPTELGRAIEAVLRRVQSTGQVVVDNDFTARSPHNGEVRHWQSQWFPAHDAAGEIIGVAVLVVDVTERRRSEDALRRSQQRTQRLQQATAELASALTVDQVAAVVSRIGRDTVAADWTGVALLEGDRVLFASADGEDSGMAPFMPGYSAELRTPTTLAVSTRKPIYVKGRQQLAELIDEAYLTEFFRSSEEQAWVAIPLVSSGAPLGAMRFSFRTEREIDHEDRVFLEALAGQCALAVERARLYEREHRTAQALQRSLLPDRLPTIDGLELVSRYLPGLDEAQVGGDWYDAFSLPSGHVAVVVGDVMGKGVAAAAGMGRVRAALRALAFADSAPRAVLTGLDRVFTATEDPDYIVTLLYAVIDPVDGSIIASCAGHPPMLYAPYDGPTRLLDVGGGSTPLGLPEERTEMSFTLRAGDTLVAFSDGLVETRRRSIGEGLDLLLEVAPDIARQRLDPLVDGLLATMAADERHSDDVTVLAVRWRPDAASG